MDISVSCCPSGVECLAVWWGAWPASHDDWPGQEWAVWLHGYIFLHKHFQNSKYLFLTENWPTFYENQFPIIFLQNYTQTTVSLFEWKVFVWNVPRGKLCEGYPPIEVVDCWTAGLPVMQCLAACGSVGTDGRLGAAGAGHCWSMVGLHTQSADNRQPGTTSQWPLTHSDTSGKRNNTVSECYHVDVSNLQCKPGHTNTAATPLPWAEPPAVRLFLHCIQLSVSSSDASY